MMYVYHTKQEKKYAYIKKSFDEVKVWQIKKCSEAQKKAYKTYNSKSIQLAVNYRPGRDLQKGQRVKAYLNQTRQSANRYIRNRLKVIWIVKSLCMREHLRQCQKPQKVV